jgi:chromosome segregation ATPase
MVNEKPLPVVANAQDPRQPRLARLEALLAKEIASLEAIEAEHRFTAGALDLEMQAADQTLTVARNRELQHAEDILATKEQIAALQQELADLEEGHPGVRDERIKANALFEAAQQRYAEAGRPTRRRRINAQHRVESLTKRLERLRVMMRGAS